MTAKHIFILVLMGAASDVFSQLQERMNAHVQWNGLGFIKGTDYLRGVSSSCGVYNNERDRQEGKLSVAIDCNTEDHKIKPGFVRDKWAIKIIRKEETHNFLRQDIYGYRDCHGKEYHFFEGKRYELVTPGESIAIYRDYQQVGKRRVAKFFFRSDAGDLKPLTLENFAVEFSDEPLFLEKLHILARNNFELVKYLYVINRIRTNTSPNT